MTAGLLIAGLVVFAMAAAAVWLMRRGEAEPAARATGQAPDPAEEQEAVASSRTRQRSGSRRGSLGTTDKGTSHLDL